MQTQTGLKEYTPVLPSEKMALSESQIKSIIRRLKYTADQLNADTRVRKSPAQVFTLKWSAAIGGVSIKDINGVVDQSQGKGNYVFAVDQSLRILEALINDLATVIGGADEEKKNKLKQMINTSYAKDLSLTGVAHCFFLIQSSVKPFDRELYGFDVRAINSLLGIYVSMCKKKKAEAAQKEKAREFVPKSERATLFAKLLSQKPEFEKMVAEATSRMNQDRVNKSRVGDRPKNLEEICLLRNIDYDEFYKTFVDAVKKEYEAAGSSIKIPLQNYIETCERNLFNSLVKTK